ncbi:GNAT family N-acetyltransferase [Luteimicrobium sp. NPDC057192]|uniref:GNAT family N-acetyltransferase n=1 Tax=Luteimicrobium sp. NPDC057192 TaxID=3346042 RepID=UPI003635B7C3
MPIVVRPYAERDWDDLCRIHDAARLDELRDTVGLAAYLPLAETYENEELFSQPVRVAEVDGRVAGFVAASTDEITWLYVDPALYRRGVARALVADVLERAGDRVELEVLDANVAARAFYEAVGFVHEATTHGKLAGNEAFEATGHTLVWHRAS